MSMPAVYLSHGAPPLVDDALWVSQLQQLAKDLPTPQAILVISAHWESAPLMLGTTSTIPLVYDFGGFDPKYYRVQYRAPGAPELADRIEKIFTGSQPVAREERRGLDHGTYVPLTVMYPQADIPVLQMSLPTHDPASLLDIGARLRELRKEGVLIIGSGFATHGLPFLREFRPEATPPGWSLDFDHWLADALRRGAVDELSDFTHSAPGMPYAHPTVEHFAPLFVTLGAASDPEAAPEQVIDGYWMGLAKRSIQVA